MATGGAGAEDVEDVAALDGGGGSCAGNEGLSWGAGEGAIAITVLMMSRVREGGDGKISAKGRKSLIFFSLLFLFSVRGPANI